MFPVAENDVALALEGTSPINLIGPFTDITLPNLNTFVIYFTPSSFCEYLPPERVNASSTSVSSNAVVNVIVVDVVDATKYSDSKFPVLSELVPVGL